MWLRLQTIILNKIRFSKNEKNSPKTEKLIMKYEYSSHFMIKGVSSSLKWVVSSTGNGHELQARTSKGNYQKIKDSKGLVNR